MSHLGTILDKKNYQPRLEVNYVTTCPENASFWERRNNAMSAWIYMTDIEQKHVNTESVCRSSKNEVVCTYSK